LCIFVRFSLEFLEIFFFVIFSVCVCQTEIILLFSAAALSNPVREFLSLLLPSLILSGIRRRSGFIFQNLLFPFLMISLFFPFPSLSRRIKSLLLSVLLWSLCSLELQCLNRQAWLAIV
jgi:hypothetical protein